MARVSLTAGPLEKNQMPLDFTQYLSERLGLSESDALRVLGTWLKEYEPIASAGQEPLSRVAATASDVHSLASAPFAQTG
jgi:hypothetical protein